MANILKFPERDEETKRQRFLQDGDDILRFEDRNLAGGQMFPLPKETVYLEFGKARAKDWSNQELANLFRVKRLLDTAGIPIEIDRGITDEGDPWFLFCDSNGEVFIHLCRLDGIYTLDSPNIKTPLKGRNFNALIEEFTDRGVPGEGAASADQRVVRLERNGKMFLHPSTMLAALVWTLFLAAEELVMVIPRESAGLPAPDPSEDLETVSETVDQDIAFDPLQLILQDQDMPAGLGSPSSSMAHHLRDMKAFNEEKLGQNTFAIGLSAVAISLGFMSETQISHVNAMTLESILAMIGGQNHAPEVGVNVPDDRGLAQNDAQEFLADLTQFFDEASLSAKDKNDLAASGANGHQNTVLIDQNEAFINSTENQVSALFDEQMQPQYSGPPVDIFNNALYYETVQNTLVKQTTASVQEMDQMVQMLFRFDLVNISQNNELNVHYYNIDSKIAFSSFDINAGHLENSTNFINNSRNIVELDKDILDLELGNSPYQQDKLKIYGEEAFDFIAFLMFKDTNLELIAAGDDIVIIDIDIFNVAVEDTFSASWTLNNGNIISAIGLRTDYEHYDLIA